MSREALLRGLRAASERIVHYDKATVQFPLGPTLSGYFATERERVTQVRLPVPLIAVPLQGHKEVWRGDHCQRFAAGEAFAVPSNVAFDVVNEPDRRSGLYESVVFVCPPRLMAAPVSPTRARADAKRSLLIRCDAEVVTALVHASNTLADSDTAADVAQLRMREVLVLLRSDPAVRAMFECERAAQVASIVRTDVSRPWRIDEVARRLHRAASTLRRQLAAEGASFREIVKSERMAVAEQLLARRGTSVGEAAEAAGYTSRSHFARRFRESYGASPRTYL